MRLLFRFACLWFCLSAALPAKADSSDASTAQSETEDVFALGEIELVGLQRTTREFVLNELGFLAGQQLSWADVEAGAQRLRNTNFFVSVQVEPHPGVSDRTNLRFVFKEKWTLTPVLRGGSGGGVNFLVLGLYDLNLLGRGIEAGGQYEQYAGAHGINIWWRQPHIRKSPWRLSVDVQVGQRPVFYLNPATSSYETPLAHKNRVVLAAQRRVSIFEFGLGVEPLVRALTKSLSAPIADYADFARTRESGLQTRFLLRLNRMKINDYLWEGHRIETSFAHLFPTESSMSEGIQSASAQSTHFWRIAERHNMGLRLQVQWTNGTSLLALSRLGSLDAVRGMEDGERIGQWAWSVNAEERWLTFVNEDFVAQTVIFADAGNAGQSLTDSPYRNAASTGVGVRLGFRPIARLRLRADYAHALFGLRKRHSGVVGMQHYF